MSQMYILVYENPDDGLLYKVAEKTIDEAIEALCSEANIPDTSKIDMDGLCVYYGKYVKLTKRIIFTEG